MPRFKGHKVLEFDIIPMPKPQNIRRGDGKKIHYSKLYFAKLSEQERKRLEYIKRYFLWKETVAWLAQQAGYTVPGVFKACFILPMPESWKPDKKRDMTGKAHEQTPDLDNLEKAFIDAICEDDKHIHTHQTRKVWGSVGKIQVPYPTKKEKIS